MPHVVLSSDEGRQRTASGFLQIFFLSLSRKERAFEKEGESLYS